MELETRYEKETTAYAECNGSMKPTEDKGYHNMLRQRKIEQVIMGKQTRKNGRLLYKLLGIFMMQMIIAAFSLDFYYWQKIPVPDYYGCAIVILMCLMAAHMLI